MRFKKIWVIYFLIKVFYLLFAILVFSKITTLGDTLDYLNASLSITPSIIYNSTDLMNFSGAVFKTIFRIDVLACIPLMLLSFYGVYYAIDRLNLYRYSVLLVFLLSLPNFGVWTSIHSKEAVGCFFSGVMSVMLVKTLKGSYKLKFIDYFAMYLCLIFKPQYLIFILQALVYLKIVNKVKDKQVVAVVLGLIVVLLNIFVIYYFRDLIDELAKGMSVHFNYSDPDAGQSTRSEAPWMVPFGFFHAAPYGLFISFFGPTLNEMLSKPTHLLSGIESVLILGMFIVMVIPRLKYIFFTYRINPKVFFTYTIIIIGILFVHYPFGFLNPGSAVRYRENFYLLFVIMIIYLKAIHPRMIHSQVRKLTKA